MRMFVLILILLAFLTGCAHSAPVTLTWTHPIFTTTPGMCTILPDTLKNLAYSELWAQRQGRSDSTLVITKTCIGKEGKPDSVTVDQPEGVSIYWVYEVSTLGNKGCKSNVASKTIILSPGAAVLK